MVEEREFKMPVTWIADGVVHVKDKSVNNAVEQIEKGKVDFPGECQNIIGTMEVDFERVEEMNPGLKLSEEP